MSLSDGLSLDDRISMTQKYLADLLEKRDERDRQAVEAGKLGIDGLALAAVEALNAVRQVAGGISPELVERALGGVLRDADIEAPTSTSDPFHTLNKD